MNNVPGSILGGVSIDVVDEHKYLDYIIDKHLKFNSQIAKLNNKLKSCNPLLARLSYILPDYTLKTIFEAISLSHIIYNEFILVSVSNNQKNQLSNKVNIFKAIINHKGSDFILKS